MNFDIKLTLESGENCQQLCFLNGLLKNPIFSFIEKDLFTKEKQNHPVLISKTGAYVYGLK